MNYGVMNLVMTVTFLSGIKPYNSSDDEDNVT